MYKRQVREGLTAVVSVKLGEPQFEGQTKTKLGNSEVKGFVQGAMTSEFGDWLERHPGEGREIVRKAVQAAAARVAAVSYTHLDVYKRQLVAHDQILPLETTS